MALFTKGFNAVKEKVARDNEQQALRKFRYLWFKENQEVVVRFLDTDPVVFYEYSFEKGKKNFLSDSPDGDDLLGIHFNRKPSMKIMIPCLIRSEDPEKDASQVYIIKQGIRFSKKLDFNSDKLAKKKLDLTSQDFIITRIGSEIDTQYEFELLDKSPLTAEEKKLELPDWSKILVLPTEEEVKRYINRTSDNDSKEKSSKPQSFDDLDDDELPPF